LNYRTGVFWLTDRARAIFGYAPDDVITLERLEGSVHPDDWDLVRGAIDGAAAPDARVKVDYRIIRDGAVRWVTSSGRPHFTSAGERDRLMGVSIDITERRRAEEALRTSEARLGAAADLAGLAFYEIDFTDASMYVDDRFRELCGLPADREQGLEALQFWMEQLHPDDRQRVLAMRRKLHEGRLNRLSTEYRFLHPIQGPKWIQHLARIARRHAGARGVSVTLRPVDDGLLLAVRDDGAGFDPEHLGKRRSLGLASMRERMRLVNVTLDIESAPGEGTTVVAWVPMEGVTR
jgi:PAS domain S-box-containing protein